MSGVCIVGEAEFKDQERDSTNPNGTLIELWQSCEQFFSAVKQFLFFFKKKIGGVFHIDIKQNRVREDGHLAISIIVGCLMLVKTFQAGLV
jgi:hypothetical protein